MDEKRLTVINLSIFIERFVSSALASLLDIDLGNSKTLSNKSSAFSFRQKLDLLTDIRATDKNDVSKFQTFSEIRNQFAHNFDVHDFTTCLKYLNGAENLLRKNYTTPELEGLSIEEQLYLMYRLLFKDVMTASYKILQKVEEKIINQGKEEGSREAYERIINALRQYAQTDTNFNEKYNQIIDRAFEEIKLEENK